jgi:integrase
MGKVKDEDLQPELPTSIREVILDELHAENYDDFLAGKPVRTLGDPDEVEKLLHRIYEHIERQALDVYGSNEPWALKAWAYSNILQDVVASEETDPMVTELMSPLFEWQKQEFDPIDHCRNILELEGLKRATKQAYLLTAKRFVLMHGKKHNYTNNEVIEYLMWARKHFPRDEQRDTEMNSSYYHECVRLRQFLRRLPDADPKRQLPTKIPQMPAAQYQPVFSDEEVEELIWSSLIYDLPGDFVVRLLAATIYGCRLGELAPLSSDDISLNRDGSSITLLVLKQKGRPVWKTQPLPPSLVPLFALPVQPIGRRRLSEQLRKVCDKAGVRWPYRGGFHSIRRRLVTEICDIESSDLNVHNYMRWAPPRQFNILSIYRQTPTEETDMATLQKHPYVKLWEEILPFLLKYNSTYEEYEGHIARIMQASQSTPHNT